MEPGHFQQVERPRGVHVEVDEGHGLGQVMRGLCGAVDDQIEAAPREQFFQRSAIAYVDPIVGEPACRGSQPLEVPGRVTGWTKELAPHVVIQPNYDVPERVKVGDRLEPDEAAAACDRRNHDSEVSNDLATI